MKIVRGVQELPLPAAGKTRAVVPTMGALHAGHLSLMRAARQECDEVVVTLFVNPLQFGPNEDLAKYPRNEEHDAALVESVGADILFAPSADELVGGIQTQIRVLGASEGYEGAHRPGHFDGVATIVAKLFAITHAHHAYFGLKDRQQCAVIETMARDLNLAIHLHFLPTIREEDGLAMSSRNVYLSAEHRALAPLIYKTLCACAETIAAEPRDEEKVRYAIAQGRGCLEANGFAVDYLDLVDALSFTSVAIAQERAVLATAARIGSTRLIDNVDIWRVR